MGHSSSEPAGVLADGRRPTTATLDDLLAAQILVAWAGETAEEPRRLGWWRADLVSTYGGQDLFQRLLPQTWAWAVLQAVREAARRADAAARSRHHDPDSIRSLFHLGFEIDEHVEERLAALKRSGQVPRDVLPALALIDEGWSAERFTAWVGEHGAVRSTAEPVGRRIRGPEPELPELVRLLVAALLPLGETYPLPHVARAR